MVLLLVLLSSLAAVARSVDSCVHENLVPNAWWIPCLASDSMI